MKKRMMAIAALSALVMLNAHAADTMNKDGMAKAPHDKVCQNTPCHDEMAKNEKNKDAMGNRDAMNMDTMKKDGMEKKEAMSQ